MKITLAQLNPKVGDFDRNVAKIVDTLKQIEADKSDLLILSELYLMGYPPMDLLEKGWFLEKQDRALQDLMVHSRACPDTGILVGAALPSRLATGRGLYNAAVLIHNGEMAFSQAKTLLPTYDVFDEARYFDPAQKIQVVRFKGKTLGLSVCEDAWNEPGVWQNRPIYLCNPIAELAEHKPDLMINISASPFHAGKDRLRHRLIQNHATAHGIPFAFVNQVGGNDELIFDGRSLLLDHHGRPIRLMKPFEEQILTVDLDTEQASGTFTPQNEIESVYRALVLGLGDYLRKSGLSKAVVGLSGGIDSAVTFCLAEAALGVENVVGISMPSMYSSTGSVEDSRILADNLGAEFLVVPIKSMYDAYVAGLAECFAGRSPDVTEENIQARIRGNILMAYSNKFGHLVLSTGNKSELAMGYCTLYGDMSGGLAVISDVPKIMVYALARYINRDREIIPNAIIEKAPSAELRPDQKDQDTLPPYEILDKILTSYVEDGLSADQIIKKGMDPDVVRWVVKTINRTEYKRKQAAPGLRVTTKAFGIGRRMPIVATYDV